MAHRARLQNRGEYDHAVVNELALLASYSVFVCTSLAQQLDTFFTPISRSPYRMRLPTFLRSVVEWRYGAMLRMSLTVMRVCEFTCSADLETRDWQASIQLAGMPTVFESLRTERMFRARPSGTAVFELVTPSTRVNCLCPRSLRTRLMRAFEQDVERETVGAPAVRAIVENRVYIAREDLGVVMIELEDQGTRCRG